MLGTCCGETKGGFACGFAVLLCKGCGRESLVSVLGVVADNDYCLLLPVHAAVIAINDAIDRQIAAETFAAMKNPNAMLLNLDEHLAPVYQSTLYQAKQSKMGNVRSRVSVGSAPSLASCTGSAESHRDLEVDCEGASAASG